MIFLTLAHKFNQPAGNTTHINLRDNSTGIYMMLATRQVAKKLHERFNVQNDILSSHTDILKDMASSQKDIASSQKETLSSQKQNHSEMIEILKKIE